MSCLGMRNDSKEKTFYTDSMKSIVTAMREVKLKRLVCMTSWGTYRKYQWCDQEQWALL